MATCKPQIAIASVEKYEKGRTVIGMFRQKFSFVEGLQLIDAMNRKSGASMQLASPRTILEDILPVITSGQIPWDMRSGDFPKRFVTRRVIAYFLPHAPFADVQIDYETMLAISTGRFVGEKNKIIVIEDITAGDLKINSNGIVHIRVPDSRMQVLEEISSANGKKILNPELITPHQTDSYIYRRSSYVGPQVYGYLDKGILDHRLIPAVTSNIHTKSMQIVVELTPEDVLRILMANNSPEVCMS
ncbi:MAG: hypothetical protein ABII22_02625 [Candidatus Micrarchaeota archaeon]